MREETSSSFRWRPALSWQRKLRNKNEGTVRGDSQPWHCLASLTLLGGAGRLGSSSVLHERSRKGRVRRARRSAEGDERRSSYIPRDELGRDCRSALDRSVAPARPSSRKPSYAVGTATRLAAVSSNNGG